MVNRKTVPLSFLVDGICEENGVAVVVCSCGNVGLKNLMFCLCLCVHIHTHICACVSM